MEVAIFPKSGFLNAEFVCCNPEDVIPDRKKCSEGEYQDHTYVMNAQFQDLTLAMYRIFIAGAFQKISAKPATKTNAKTSLTLVTGVLLPVNVTLFHGNRPLA